MKPRYKLAIGLTLIVGVLFAQQPVAQGPQSSNAAEWLVNLTQVAGTALGAMANYGTSPGAVKVPGVNAFVTNTITAIGSGTFDTSGKPQTTSGYALTATDLAATAATQIKGSAGNVYGFQGFNPNVTTCYLQFYNSTSASLGTGVLHPFGVLAGASFIAQPGLIALFNLSTGISTGQTTTATGSTPCSSAMVITILYN